MGQALYRKYRSKNLDEIVGQEHITQTLSNALKNDKISHAYLFTGPRGVGKTSIARILAHEVNALPYDDDSNHIDIIEIDAASNRRIDEIRELRERVHIAPTSTKYKVYIIDEVHMLTKEAFNALLKTLEEPPEHVIFILATTEVHKLPETIVSRTQRFTFKPIDPVVAVEHLKAIAKTEKLQISDEALALIAEHGDGSFRDSISLLDQARSLKSKVELQDVQQMLGVAPQAAIQQLIEALQTQHAPSIITTLQQLSNQGYQASALASQLLHELRDQLLQNNLSLDATGTLQLMEYLLVVSSHSDPQTALELALLTYVFKQAPPSATPQVINEPVNPPSASSPTQNVTVSQTATPKKSKPTAPQRLTNDNWPEFLTAVKNRHNTLYGVVRMATPEFSDDALLLTFEFPFHQKRLNEAKNQQLLQDILIEFTGQPVAVKCLVSTEHLPAKQAPPQNASEAIETISNIFGGAELMD